jgi:NAD-dependent histone deacetylase SIR2
VQLIQVLSKVVQKFLRQRKKLPNVNTLEDVVKLLRESKNIMVLTGAGVRSTLFVGKNNFLFKIL